MVATWDSLMVAMKESPLVERLDVSKVDSMASSRGETLAA